MPSTSNKQRRFMSAAAHDKDFASKAGIDQSVAKEFNNADKRKHIAKALRSTGGTSTGSIGGGSAAG